MTIHACLDLKALRNGVLLCIDDNQDVLECEKALLETFGYIVLTAITGSKGLEMASLHAVDAVIVDYSMPERNGQEFAIARRRLGSQIPIIMLSAALDVPEQALKVVDAFIAKDCLANQLLPAIAQLRGRFDFHIRIGRMTVLQNKQRARPPA